MRSVRRRYSLSLYENALHHISPLLHRRQASYIFSSMQRSTPLYAGQISFVKYYETLAATGECGRWSAAGGVEEARVGGKSLARLSPKHFHFRQRVPPRTLQSQPTTAPRRSFGRLMRQSFASQTRCHRRSRLWCRPVGCDSWTGSATPLRGAASRGKPQCHAAGYP